MKKIKIKLFITIIFPLTIISQEIQREMISSQGESVELDSGIYVTQTIGQHSVASYSIDNLTVQQGYQQSFWNSLINTNEEFNVDITFYPNPTIDYVNFNFSNLESSDLNVLVFDYAGRVLITTTMPILHFQRILDQPGNGIAHVHLVDQ